MRPIGLLNLRRQRQERQLRKSDENQNQARVRHGESRPRDRQGAGRAASGAQGRASQASTKGEAQAAGRRGVWRMKAPRRVTINGCTAYIPEDVRPHLKHRYTMKNTTEQEQEFLSDVISCLERQLRCKVWWCSFQKNAT